jgi:hypothetical protein
VLDGVVRIREACRPRIEVDFQVARGLFGNAFQVSLQAAPRGFVALYCDAVAEVLESCTGLRDGGLEGHSRQTNGVDHAGDAPAMPLPETKPTSDAGSTNVLKVE